jgi:hypothetical protein
VGRWHSEKHREPLGGEQQKGPYDEIVEA